MIYTDPSGLDSGYLIQSEGVANAGHAAHWVEKYDDDGKSVGFSVYEFSGGLSISGGVGIEDIATKTGGSASVIKGTQMQGVGNPFSNNDSDAIAAIWQIDFQTMDEMKAYFEGRNFLRSITFDTDFKQDRAIAAFTENELAESIDNYDGYSGNCNDFALNGLSAGGNGLKGINTVDGWYPNGVFDKVLESLRTDPKVFGAKPVSILDRDPNWRERLPNIPGLTSNAKIFGNNLPGEANKADNERIRGKEDSYFRGIYYIPK